MITQSSDESCVTGCVQSGAPVAWSAFRRKAPRERTWPRAAKCVPILETLFVSPQPVTCWGSVCRGTAAWGCLPVPVRGSAAWRVLPVRSPGATTWLVLPAVTSRNVLLPPVLFFPGSAAFLPPRFRLCGPSPAASAGAAGGPSCHGSSRCW